MTNSLKIEIDNEMETGYVTFSRSEVHRTVSLDELINLDLDKAGAVVGLELLALEATLPQERLVEEFGLDASLVKKLSVGLFR